MPAFFEHLPRETEPSVRVVLGNFVFVHIPPYTDGNGRMGRFLMNVLLAAGGYAWTAVPQRDAYIAALEAASMRHDIAPLPGFWLTWSKPESGEMGTFIFFEKCGRSSFFLFTRQKEKWGHSSFFRIHPQKDECPHFCLHQLLVEMLDRETIMAIAGKRQQPVDLVRRRALGRRRT